MHVFSYVIAEFKVSIAPRHSLPKVAIRLSSKFYTIAVARLGHTSSLLSPNQSVKFIYVWSLSTSPILGTRIIIVRTQTLASGLADLLGSQFIYYSWFVNIL